jgi:hypothetical protein
VSAPAARAARVAPRRFSIGEKKPVEMAILRDGTIRMRGPGHRRVLTTSVANVYYSALRSSALTDIRLRQRRAAVLTTVGRGR